MSHEEHVANAMRTVKRARQPDSSVLYAARFLVRHLQHMRCSWCGNRPHKRHVESHVHD